MDTITFNGLEFKVYTEIGNKVNALNGKIHTLYSIIAYNEKHNLYYRGYINKYAGDLFDYVKLCAYIDKLISDSDIHFEMLYGHMNFINWKIQYGSICGEPLITEIEFCCKNNDFDSVDDIIKRGAKCEKQMYVPNKTTTYNIDTTANLISRDTNDITKLQNKLQDKELIKLIKKTQNGIRNLYYTSKRQDL